MFIVQNAEIAQTICRFYENPEHIGLKDDLLKLGLLEHVERYISIVKALQLSDFIKNDRWVGISPEMDKYLPTVIYNSEQAPNRVILNRSNVLRAVSIASTTPITTVGLSAGKLEWFTGKTPGYSEFTIDINPGMPTALLFKNEIAVFTNEPPTTVQTMHTILPVHILKKLLSIKQVIVPSQGKDYYCISGCMETI